MNVLFFLIPKSEVAHLQKEWTLRQAIEKLERSGYRGADSWLGRLQFQHDVSGNVECIPGAGDGF